MRFNNYIMIEPAKCVSTLTLPAITNFRNKKQKMNNLWYYILQHSVSADCQILCEEQLI